MTTQTNAESVQDKTCVDDTVLEPSLKSFVQMVKTNLINQTKNRIKPSEIIKSLEILESKLTGSNGHASGTKCSRAHNTLLLDPILHHRVMLATGIARSFATGSDLSCKRRKILQSNIEYIENRL